MKLSRWLTVSAFVFATMVAWQMAKPPQTPASAPLASPGNPCNDAINTRTLIPARGIMTPTEPLKFSDARAD